MKTLKDIQTQIKEALTPKQLRKREEIARRLDKERPGLDVSTKLAIATARARSVREDVEQLDEMDGPVGRTASHHQQTAEFATRQAERDVEDFKKKYPHHTKTALIQFHSREYKRHHDSYKVGADPTGHAQTAMFASARVHLDALRKLGGRMNEDLEQLDELSNKTLGSYIKKAKNSIEAKSAIRDGHYKVANDTVDSGPPTGSRIGKAFSHIDQGSCLGDEIERRKEGVDRAKKKLVSRLTKEGVTLAVLRERIAEALEDK